MNNRYEVKEILHAVNEILNKTNNKLHKQIKNVEEKPLELINEVKNSRKKLQNIPKDTENIILQAEKYLKK